MSKTDMLSNRFKKTYSRIKCVLTDVHVASVMLSLKVMKLIVYLLNAKLQ